MKLQTILEQHVGAETQTSSSERIVDVLSHWAISKFLDYYLSFTTL